MDARFWLDRWQAGNTGWHQADVHPFLERHWPAGRRRAFVPLCGASLDMRWLRRRGLEVVGVDLSPLALRRFFDAAGLEPVVDRTCQFERWVADGYELLAGDVFDVDASVLGPFDAVYDRAALVALPPPLRERYAARLAELCAPGTAGLLVTFEYDQREMAGPPFAVPEVEVRRLLEPAFDVALAAREDVLAANEGLRGRGVTALAETAWRLTRP